MRMHKSGLATLFAMLALGAEAMTPGGVEKKFVGLCFDTMFNSPSNILAHADGLDAIPWLDGIAIGLHDVVLRAAGGSAVTTGTCRVMQLGHRWTHEAVAGELPFARELVKHPSMQESFLLAWITPVGKENRIPWGDDAEWGLFAENMATLAWFAKEAGLKGLMLDPEEYSSAWQFRYKRGDAKSFAACAELARRRGREVFSAIFREFPDAVIFALWGFEHCVRYYSDRFETDPRQLADDHGDLLPYFYNGMLDVMPPGVRFVDGSEHYTLSAKRDMWWKGGINQFVGAQPFVAPENWAKYRAQLLVGNAHYLDMYSMNSKPGGWYHGPVDGSRLEHLRINVVQSLQTADKYVWIYAENGRLIDWKGGPTRHQNANKPLWEEQIPGLTETLLMAKDPDRLMVMCMDEYRKKGELKNLLEGQGTFPVTIALADKPTRMELPKPPSVKGVMPGELYLVRQQIRATMREGAPSVMVAWRKNGEPVAEKASVPLVGQPAKNPREPLWAQAYATVPEGADELVIDVAGDLFPGDAVYAGSSEAYLLDYAPAAKAQFSPAPEAPEVQAAASGRKWVFDEAAKKLSDGNWTLSATYVEGDKTKTRLAVNGKNAEGSGILDFRGVEADTGRKVTCIYNFYGNQNITELIGPDVVSVMMDGFKACNSLRSVVLSPELRILAMSAFSSSTNLVHFSPMTFKEDTRLGLGIFQFCHRLKGDFRYEGTNNLPEKLFWQTAISSFRAPRSNVLGEMMFSDCPELTYVSFAEGMAFSNAQHRAAHLSRQRRRAGLMKNLLPKNRAAGELKSPAKIPCRLPSPLCVDGVKPGELYGVGISLKATSGIGAVNFEINWRANGQYFGGWFDQRSFSMKGPRQDGVWRRGSVLVRVPPGADGLALKVWGDVFPGESFEFDKPEIFKLGDPIPPWPTDGGQPGEKKH
jgi:hypothetical protein